MNWHKKKPFELKNQSHIGIITKKDHSLIAVIWPKRSPNLKTAKKFLSDKHSIWTSTTTYQNEERYVPETVRTG